MYVHRQAKLAFLASPRTASRAVRDALRQPAIGFLQEGAHHDGPDQGYSLAGYLPFTVVRNHWDTAVSWWYNTRMNAKEERPSLTWLAKHFSKNRYYFRAGTMFWFRQVPGVAVLRYENLEAELNALLSGVGLRSVKLSRVGESKPRERRHYSTFYDSDTREFVNWCFLKEINELGYQFKEDPPWNT